MNVLIVSMVELILKSNIIIQGPRGHVISHAHKYPQMSTLPFHCSCKSMGLVDEVRMLKSGEEYSTGLGVISSC